MKFKETPIPGACIVEIEPITDGRGFFARGFCRREFEKAGLNPDVVQCNISFNEMRGALRGMHFQVKPREEAKLIRCSRGAIFDVIIDLRPESLSYCRWFSIELSHDGNRMLYVPEGCAHGFQTLEDDTEVLYQMSEYYAPECARGVRCNDPAFGIKWPIPNPIMSEKDMSYEDFKP